MNHSEDITRLMPDVHPTWAVPAAAIDGDPTVTVRPPESACPAETEPFPQTTHASEVVSLVDSPSTLGAVTHDPASLPPISGSDSGSSRGSGSGSLHSVSQPATWTDLSSSAIGRYAVRGELGSGGMGVVFSAMQGSLGREVAVKVLRDVNDAKLRAAFLDEARLAAALDHPGCVPIHDAGADFLVMRLVRGQTFSVWLAQHQPIAAHLADAIEILIAVSDAVGHAHANGIVHRDLKPGNILIGEGPGEVMVADWGLAVRIVDGHVHLGSTGACAGTPSYLPPEVARGQAELLGTASDVFLLGAILHRVLSGRPPWPGKAAEAVRAAAQCDRIALEHLAPNAPAALVALAEHALAEEPAARGDCAAFVLGLRTWLGGSATDRAAAIALAEAEAELLTANIAGTSYARTTAAVTASVAAAERCLATWPDHQRAHHVRDLALTAGTQRALQVGDLALAGLFVGRIRAAEVRASANTAVTAAITKRTHRQRTLRHWSAAGALGISAAVLALYGAWTWQAQADRRDHARRQLEADALLGAVTSDSGQRVVRSPGQAAAAAYRALGLVPDSAAALTQASAATQVAFTQALAAGDRRLAQALVDRQTRLSQSLAQPLVGQLLAYDVAGQQRAAAAVTHWQDDFQRIAGLSANGQKPSDLKPAAVPHVAALLASWPGEQVQPVIAGLAASAVPEERLAACAAASIRPALIPSNLLTPLLKDANSDVRRAAWHALAHARDVAAWPAMLRYLGTFPDPWDARLAAAEMGTWGCQRLSPSSDLHQRWIVGDHRGWLAELATQAEPAANDLTDAPATAWYGVGDAALAETWIARLEKRQPKNPEVYVMRAEIELDQGHADAAYARLHALADDMPQRLPLLIFAAYRLKRSAELPALGAKLDRICMSTEWGHRRLQVRSALQLALGQTGFVSDLGTFAKAAMAPARQAWLDGDSDAALAQARIGRMRWTGSSAGEQILAGSAMAACSDSHAHTTGALSPEALANDALANDALATEALAATRRIAIPLNGVPMIASLAQQRLGHVDTALAALAAENSADAGDAGATIIAAARREDRVAAVHRLLSARIPMIGNSYTPDAPDPRLVQIRDLLERGLGGLAVRRLATYENPDATVQRDLLDQVLLGVPELQTRGWPWRPANRVARDLLHEAALAIELDQAALASRRLEAAAPACGDSFTQHLLAALRARLAKAADAPTLVRRLTLDFPAEVVTDSWVYDLNTNEHHDTLRLRPLPDLTLDPEGLTLLRRLAATWISTMRPAPGPLLLMSAGASSARTLIPHDPLATLTLPEAPPSLAWDAWLKTQSVK